MASQHIASPTCIYFCRFLSVILYLMFLFMIVIVLLSTLIAQVSHTYTKVLSTAEGVHLFYQCAYIAKLETRKSQFLILFLKMPHGRCWTCLEWLGTKIGCNCFAFVSWLFARLSLCLGTNDALYSFSAIVALIMYFANQITDNIYTRQTLDMLI